MAIGQYQGVGGVARKVTKRYQGVGGVARNVTKAYIGVDGVARQYFGCSVEWKKYNAIRTVHYYYEEDDIVAGGEGETTLLEVPDGGTLTMFFSDYSFISSGGISSGGYYGLGSRVSHPVGEGIGNYMVNHTRVYIVSGAELNGDIWTYTGMLVARASIIDSSFSYPKGQIDYGSVYSSYGDLPEDGTLVDGSVNDSYCVLKIGNDYYYYERV